jgi:hypothetical protein
MKTTQFTIILCMTVLVFASGCVSPKPKQPLSASEGWRQLLAREYQKLDPAIKTDFQVYLGQLPLKERSQVTDSSIDYFANTNGQHAVHFEIGKPALFGKVFWAHVLIYDVDNRRVRVIKYRSDRAITI